MTVHHSVLFDAGHPVWGIVRILAVAFLLWLTASDFDETEGLVIGGQSVAEIALQVVKGVLKKGEA